MRPPDPGIIETVWLAIASVAMLSCNWAFGIRSTEVIPPTDAQYFDAPADAPYQCPPTGTAPTFSRLLHQIPQGCQYYRSAESADLAVVSCWEPTNGLMAGPIDGPFTPAPGLAPVAGVGRLFPQLAPEGDELFFVEYITNTPQKIVAFRMQSGSWQYAYDVMEPRAPNGVAIGTPTRGPTRRMMMSFYLNMLHEIEVDASGNTREIGAYDAAFFGATYVESPPSLTPDGLRMIANVAAATQNEMRYADRPSIDVRFSNAVPLVGVPPVYDAFMTGDCSRIYFSGVNSLLWVQQQ